MKLTFGAGAMALLVYLLAVMPVERGPEAVHRPAEAVEQSEEMVHPPAAVPPAESGGSVRLQYDVVIAPEHERGVIYRAAAEERPLALGPDLEQQRQARKKPREGVFAATLEAALADGYVALTYTLKNISGQDVRVHYGSGQKYDFVVYGEERNEVYRWSRDKSFTAALIPFVFAAGSELTFAEVWDLRDNAGLPVPPGTYTIVFAAALAPDSGALAPGQLAAEAVVAVGGWPK